MKKNRNTKVLTGALAATLLLGAGSLAWFTDRTESTIDGYAGTVLLSEVNNTSIENMAPGDMTNFTIEGSYEGSLDGKVRVRIQNTDEDGEKIVHMRDWGYAIFQGEGDDLKEVDLNDGIVFQDVLEQGEEFKIDDLYLSLREESNNDYQESEVKLRVVVEALQERNSGTDWELVADKTITILEAAK